MKKLTYFNIQYIGYSSNIFLSYFNIYGAHTVYECGNTKIKNSNHNYLHNIS